MSEFTCKNGHIMRPGQLVCSCGESLYQMDGLSKAELRRQEEDEYPEEDSNNEDN